MKSFLTALKESLKDFPTTVIVTLTGCFLAVYSGVMFWIAIWREWRMDEVTLVAWLGFVAALCGIAYFWFGKKRETYQQPAAKDREDTPGPGAQSPLPTVPATMDQGEA